MNFHMQYRFSSLSAYYSDPREKKKSFNPLPDYYCKSSSLFFNLRGKPEIKQ